jgi:para-aminobenzoate synthetase component 1
MVSAWWAGCLATGVVDVADLRERPDALEGGGWWAVVAEFEGRLRAWRFADVRAAPLPVSRPEPDSGDAGPSRWRGPHEAAWSSSMSRSEYERGVTTNRQRIRDGDVYQVNLCRVLQAPLATGDPYALATVLACGNPAPYAGVLDLGEEWVVSASPELFLERSGGVVSSSPIKGTAPTERELLPKDRAENLMITDLVRNDLQRVCRPGTVAVPSLLRTESHPGLVHLVSTVRGALRDGVTWAEILEATLPPGSVSGAPKQAALDLIAELEPVSRGPYCGAVGFVDADAGQAVLAVGIRTFWWHEGLLRFGTGAGITWGSDPAGEWQETELKAERLIRLASGDSGSIGA